MVQQQKVTDEEFRILRSSLIEEVAREALEAVHNCTRSNWEAEMYLEIVRARARGEHVYKTLLDRLREAARYRTGTGHQIERCEVGGKRTLQEAPNASVGPLTPILSDENYGFRVIGDFAVLDIDAPHWPGVLLGVVDEFKDVAEAPRVITPHGAHVYMLLIGRAEGRWKHASLPCTLIRSGHVMGPGSIVDGVMYIPDPTQEEDVTKKLWEPSLLPLFTTPPGGPDAWPGYKENRSHLDFDDS